jgi:hypothetical protein
MRPLLPGDMDYAVRALMAVPSPQRPALALQLIAEADTADRYRKRLHCVHPQFGNGSVMSAASGHRLAQLTDWCDTAYCQALATFLDAVLNRPQTHSIR